MSQLGNAALDFADRLAERERLAGLERVQAAARGQMAPSGRHHCLTCGEPIAAARRAAQPAATDCIDCATFAERQQRRRA